MGNCKAHVSPRGVLCRLKVNKILVLWGAVMWWTWALKPTPDRIEYQSKSSPSLFWSINYGVSGDIHNSLEVVNIADVLQSLFSHLLILNFIWDFTHKHTRLSTHVRTADYMHGCAEFRGAGRERVGWFQICAKLIFFLNLDSQNVHFVALKL